jgi:hypothetical protein
MKADMLLYLIALPVSFFAEKNTSPQAVDDGNFPRDPVVVQRDFDAI